MSTVKATYSGFVSHDGIPFLLTTGEDYDADHPLVEARPDLFSKPAKSQPKTEPELQPAPKPEPKRAPGRPLAARKKTQDVDPLTPPERRQTR